MPHEMIRRELVIAASPETVWRLVGTAEGLRRWWGAEILLEPHEGGHCEEHLWQDGKLRTMRGVVTAYEPPQHLALTWQAAADADDHADTDDLLARWPALTTVSITLAQEQAGTRVTVVHRAFGDGPALAIGAPLSKPSLPQPAAPPHRREVEALLPGARRAHSAVLPALGQGAQELPAADWRRRTDATLDERIARLSGLFSEPVIRSGQ